LKIALFGLLSLFVVSSTFGISSRVPAQSKSGHELALGIVNSGTYFEPNPTVPKRDNINESDYDQVAENMFKVKQALTGKYSLADNITLGMYVLRYLADLGTYEVANEDIMALLASLEQLTGEPFDPAFKEMMGKVAKIYFGRREDRPYVRIYSFAEDGIKVALNRPGTGSVKTIKYLMIKNKAKIYFSDMADKKASDDVKNFIKSKNRFLFIPIKALNQVHSGVVDHIKTYLNAQRPVAPLQIEVKGVFVSVSTSTIFKDIDFYLKKAVMLPGITDGKVGLPPFVAEARGKLIKVKISIDQ